MMGAILIVMSPERRETVFLGADDLMERAVCATTCQEAREILKKQPAPTAVITDLSLPDGNWWCVYHDVAEGGLETECVVLATEPGADHSNMLASGAFAVVEPPWPVEELRRIVRAAEEHTVVAVP